jgi:hypothetical protein
MTGKGFQTFMKVGFPMLAFTIGGFAMLNVFMQTSIEVKDKNITSTSLRIHQLEGEAFSLKLQINSHFSPNSEENKNLLGRLDIDNYSLSRIPRPDEAKDVERKP